MPNAEPPVATDGPVLFYDASCGLCQRAVRFLLRHDRRARIRFAALQGPTAQRFLRERGLPRSRFESLIWVPEWQNRSRGTPLFRTDGALAALRELPPLWRWLAWFRIVPVPVRDAAYRFVARIRFFLFGPPRAAPFSRPDWSARFLP